MRPINNSPSDLLTTKDIKQYSHVLQVIHQSKTDHANNSLIHDVPT